MLVPERFKSRKIWLWLGLFLVAMLWPIDIHDRTTSYLPLGAVLGFCAGEYFLGLLVHPIYGWVLFALIALVLLWWLYMPKKGTQDKTP